jgi:hypothetical protein
MRKFVVGSILAIVVVAMVAGTASAQFGVGAMVPLEVFLAYHVSENVLLQAGVPLGGLGGFFLALALDLNAKLFFTPLQVAESVFLKPYLGAGVVIVTVFDTLVFSPYGMAGVEYRFPGTQVSLFGDLGVGVAFTALGLGVGVAPAIGIRLDF